MLGRVSSERQMTCVGSVLKDVTNGVERRFLFRFMPKGVRMQISLETKIWPLMLSESD